MQVLSIGLAQIISLAQNVHIKKKKRFESQGTGKRKKDHDDDVR